MAAYQEDPRYQAEYAAYRGERLSALSVVEHAMVWAQEDPRIRFQLAVEDEAERMIGTVGIRRASPDAPEADLGGELAPDLWRRGYGTEAAEAMISFAFDTLNIEAVRIVTANPGGRRMALALNFTQVETAVYGTSIYRLRRNPDAKLETISSADGDVRIYWRR